MDIYKNVKEFILYDKMKMKIGRNDFEDLGSILEIEFLNCTYNNFMLISFYDYNKLQLMQNQIVLLTNHQTIFFDNILILYIGKENSNNQIIIKLLNKEIYFMKLFCFNLGQNKMNQFKHLIDTFNLENIDMKQMKEFKTKPSPVLNKEALDKNEHLNLIIEELNRVNQSLVAEKELIEKNKIIIRTKEENINAQILNFKKEIMLYSDKFFNESSAKFQSKLQDVSKKLTMAETNFMNKYKLIKEKFEKKNLTASNKTTKNSSNTNLTGNIANLEIKNKFLEDSLNSLKTKLNEKEEMIKNFQENEEKLNKSLKKMKEEIILLNSKLKNNEEVINNLNNNNKDMMIKNASPEKEKKEKKKIRNSSPKKNILSLNKFEISKHQVHSYTEYFVLEIINKKSESFSEKESQILANLIINIAINPINLFNKFPMSFIFLIKKLSTYFQYDNFTVYIKSSINDILNSNPDIKKQILQESEINKDNCSITNSYFLVTLSNINSTLIQKLDYFNNYIQKNEKKFLEKNNFILFKLISISNLFFQILFTNLNEFSLEVYNYFTIIYSNFFKQKDFICINYIISLNYFEIIVTIINNLSIDSKVFQDFFLLFLDSFLNIYTVMPEINLLEQNKKLYENILTYPKIMKIIKNYLNSVEKSRITINKILIFLNILSSTTQIKVFFEEFKSLEKEFKSNDDLMVLNLNKLIKNCN